jgi:biopolymer transport protein ExbB/TolQ
VLLFVNLAASQEFTVWSLVSKADIVVQSVMAGLVLMSIACWAIIIEKYFRLRSMNGQLRRLDKVASGGEIDQIKPQSLVGKLLNATKDEHANGVSAGEGRNEVRGRLERAMRTSLKGHMQSIEKGLPFLATTGSAAPFIGLFGTVWGIMNSFTAIGQKADTSLATVAPGIAEALFATALGLAAAIPAVVAYNQISVALGRGAARAQEAIVKIAKSVSGQQSPSEPMAANVTPLHTNQSGATH